jgi:tRNA A-37 threonylcarbamoyl transferase component Bud32/pimeloyl-ACP methyl ester carboxylesterase
MPYDPASPLAAALADRYRIERPLGQGGMAVVYLADDLKHGRKVAIKILRPEVAAAVGVERFVREIRTSATLQHPHILGLIDSGEANGTAYYVMPLVEGESLRDRLRREKQLPVADAVRIASEIASALDYAHRRGIIHRDIKPENILLQDGQALVADFGIALGVTSSSDTRMTGTGISVGTPHYMSPEQAMGERDITARSDVYSLGCVTYEMLLGEPPFTGPTTQAIVAKVLTERPGSVVARRHMVPVAIERAIHTALQKLPADRFASTIAFSAALASAGSEATAHKGTAEPTVTSGAFRLSEDTCRRLARTSFDPRLIGSTMHYLDNGVESDVLVCYIPACGRAANQYDKVLETATYRAVAVTFRGFEPVTAWRPSLSLDDHMVLVREFLRDVVARLRPRITIIGGFSSGADFAIRLAAAPDPEPRLRLDGCLALGANLSIDTCFLTSELATLNDRDDAGLLAILRRVSNQASSLDEWVNLCEYAVSIVPTFRHDVAALRAFGAAISAPFATEKLTPFADWYRAAAAKGCQLRCVFEDTPMFRDLVRELQLRNLDDGLLGPQYEEGSIVAEAGTGHFDLIGPSRVEDYVLALVDRLTNGAAR